MKNRLYYSEKQAKIAGYNYIIKENGEKNKYTQWCTEPDHFCRWDDAKLVYACDEDDLKIELVTIPEKWDYRLN